MLLKIVMAMKTKERLKNCHRPEETKETQQLRTVWYPELDESWKSLELVGIYQFDKYTMLM